MPALLAAAVAAKMEGNLLGQGVRLVHLVVFDARHYD